MSDTTCDCGFVMGESQFCKVNCNAPKGHTGEHRHTTWNESFQYNPRFLKPSLTENEYKVMVLALEQLIINPISNAIVIHVSKTLLKTLQPESTPDTDHLWGEDYLALIRAGAEADTWNKLSGQSKDAFLAGMEYSVELRKKNEGTKCPTS